MDARLSLIFEKKGNHHPSFQRPNGVYLLLAFHLNVQLLVITYSVPVMMLEELVKKTCHHLNVKPRHLKCNHSITSSWVLEKLELNCVNCSWITKVNEPLFQQLSVRNRRRSPLLVELVVGSLYAVDCLSPFSLCHYIVQKNGRMWEDYYFCFQKLCSTD